MPPTIPQENRNQAKMIPAVFHSPDSYWKGITLNEWWEVAAFKQLRQKEQEGNLEMAPQPSVPLPQTFFSYCCFSKDINEHDDKTVMDTLFSFSLFCLFLFLSVHLKWRHAPPQSQKDERRKWEPSVVPHSAEMIAVDESLYSTRASILA